MKTNKFVDEVAKTFYDVMPYVELNGKDAVGEKPAWEEGGNSLKQDEARKHAIEAIKTIRTLASDYCSADGRATYIWIGKQLEDLECQQ
jgi:hypothetical protein